MKTGWKIAVVILLVAGVVIALATKNRSRSDSFKRPSVPQAAKSAPTDANPEPVKLTPKEEKRSTPVGIKPSTAVKPENSKPAQPVVKPTDKPKISAQQKPVTDNPPKPSGRLAGLAEFGSDKCIPCKAMAPILDELRNEYKGKLDVVFTDVWEDRKAGETYGIQSIPTQVFYDADGNELSRHVGFFSKEDIIARFKQHGINLTR